MWFNLKFSPSTLTFDQPYRIQSQRSPTQSPSNPSPPNRPKFSRDLSQGSDLQLSKTKSLSVRDIDLCARSCCPFADQRPQSGVVTASPKFTAMPSGYSSRDVGDPNQVKKNKQSMADLKLRRLTELNNRLREDLDRERIPVSQASKRYGSSIL